MHELAVCQSLVDQLDQIASDYPDKRITVVHLQIGPLSGVVPELLKDAFPIASAGTPAQDAQLLFHDSEIEVRCSECGQTSAAQINKLVCGHCGNWQTELVSGDELMLQQVELETTVLH